MSAIVLLFLLGCVLLGCELAVPGTLMGILGTVAMAAGCVVAFVQFGAGAGVIAMLSALALAGLTLYLEFGLLPKTRWGRRLFLRSAIVGTSQAVPEEAEAMVGRTGEAVTTLAPSGYVEVDGRRYEAFSQSGLVEKGAKLRVVARDNFRLIVNLIN